MSYQVFISYSHIDSQIAFGLCFKLEEQGIDCWIAPRNIRPGANFASEIAYAIPNCKVMLLILSKSSNSSPQVLRELELAANSRLVIIPVRIEEIMPTGGMSYYLAATQWIDIKGKKIDSKITLISKHIKDILGVVEEKEKATKKNDRKEADFRIETDANLLDNSKEKKKSSNIKKLILILVASLTVLTAAVFLIFNWGSLTGDSDRILSEPSFLPSSVNSTEESSQVTEEKSVYTPEDLGMSPETPIGEFINDPVFRDCIAGALLDMGIDLESEAFTIENILKIEGLIITTAHAEEVGSLGDVESYMNRNNLHSYKYITDGNFDNLDGLEYAKNLKCLIITEQSLNDISAIKELNGLEVVYLQNTSVANSEPLYGKT